MQGLSATGRAWVGVEVDQQKAAQLARELVVPETVGRLLVGRGYGDLESAAKFLYPDAGHLHDPRLLPDYEAAVKAILGAKERGEKIYVHGDYDVDGVTSAALLTRFLKRLDCDVVPHVPHRMREGYGIHLDAVGWAKEQGCKLFLTCDCGVQAHEQIRAVNEAGMTAVVTDHHELGETLPEAVAVVNPHRRESAYPFAEISGVGVVFKLCMGIADELGIRRENYLRAYLDLAVMGTVADVMPLTDENRVITSLGLPVLRDSKKAGVQALLKVASLDMADRLTARNIGFQLGPRINAVGRVDDASTALDLLLTDDPVEAFGLAQALDAANLLRRSHQDEALAQAIARVEAMPELPAVIVVDSEGWHPGVVGIVAGKLVEKFGRPTFVLSVDEAGNAKGSARSIEGFHLKEAIDLHRHLIIGGGGHAMAAGVNVSGQNLVAFSESVAAHAQATLSPDAFLFKVKYDAEATMAEAGPDAFTQINRMEPFGHGNPEPVWLVRDVELVGMRPTRKPEHVGVTLAQNGRKRGAMAFGIGESFAGKKIGDRMDVLVKMDMSEYRGQQEFRWTVVDHRPSG
ncbi:MAG: single-stranded-DNA-specific exonuclease RecJ [Armatimonadetes bacterium]|nr:single-stranded-DNA-specific exonuclease RecJ [Armatimonadota bacterium]